MTHRPSPRPLAVEPLEGRELPAAGPWLVEPFQHGQASGLPAGWRQWGSNGHALFSVDATAAGLGDQGRLVSDGTSSESGRAWLSAPFAADVESSAAVYLNNSVPLQLFVRGKGLDTARPSYYAAAVSRGASVALVKVVNGQTTRLGEVTTPDYTSNRWATLTVRAEGDTVRAYLHRGDTNQYLAADGTWTRSRTPAVEVTDSTLKGGGQVGFARPAGSGAEIAADSLRVGAPQSAPVAAIAEERFSGAKAGLPAGWRQWTKTAPVTFATTADDTLRVEAGSTADARAWLAAPTAADVQVSSSVYVDGLTPAAVFARGQRVNTDRPSYYSLSVGRGLDVRVWRVIDGRSVEIGRVTSKEYVAGLWVQASLVLSGDRLRVQVYRSDTGQYLRDDGTWGLAASWAMTRTDGTLKGGGSVGLARSPGYAGTLVFDNFIVTTSPDKGAAAGPIPTEGDKATTVPTPPPDLPGPVTPTPTPSAPAPSPAGLPPLHRSYPHIRLANLAYWGTPFDATTKSLLAHSVDLVIPNLSYLDEVQAASPDAAQFVYTNVSNLYLGLITDWNDYADRKGLGREQAFYHVTRATPLTGSSASSVPVNRFWGVFRGAGNDWDNLTRDSAHTGNDLTFADNGQSLAVGFLEKFREVNVDLKSGAKNGWASVLEYVSKVDGSGRPTEWKTLRTLGDTTRGLTVDGKLTFDPPRDWQAASVGGSARLFYVRFRTTHAGTAPTAATVLGRDYTAGKTIPAFDSSADKDRDGYLSDAEYAGRRRGMDARFRYESRLTFPQYGPMRFASNVSDAGFRGWAADYHARFLKDTPLADGFFVDNSSGRLAADPNGLAESLAGYAADYGSLLGAINTQLRKSGKWLVANTAGGNQSAEPIAAAGVSSLEEFALRPMAANHVQFDDLLATLTYRRQLTGGKAYEILDSLPTNGVDALDPRLQMATLAMYYAVADPSASLLMVNGGNEPASSWDRHFIAASTVDVGQPKGPATVFATGADPANKSLTYKVYGREYGNALVLYKPVSYTRGVAGTTADTTATTHKLDGWYRTVRADGSLGQLVRQVSLRNGEGAVLVKA